MKFVVCFMLACIIKIPVVQAGVSELEDEMIEKSSTTSSLGTAAGRGVTVVNLSRQSSREKSSAENGGALVLDDGVSDTAVTVITIDSGSESGLNNVVKTKQAKKTTAGHGAVTLRVGETSSESNPSSDGEEDDEVSEDVPQQQASALESYFTRMYDDDGVVPRVAKPLKGIMKTTKKPVVVAASSSSRSHDNGVPTVIQVSDEEVFRERHAGDDEDREFVVGEEEEEDDSRLLDEDGSLLSDDSDSRYQQFEAEPYVYESDNSGPYVDEDVDGEEEEHADGDDRADLDSWGEPVSNESIHRIPTFS